MEQGVYLLEMDIYTGTSVVTQYFGGKSIATTSVDNPANKLYRPKIKDVGRSSLQLTLSGISIGDLNQDSATAVLDNLDGYFDGWFGYGISGRSARLKWLGDPKSPVITATTLANLTLKGMDGSNALNEIRFTGASSIENLRKPLLTTRYAGTTVGAGPTIEGNVGLKGKLKQVFLGNSGPDRAVPCELVNEFNLIYQVSYLAVNSITAYDGGLQLGYAGDFTTLLGLISATVPPGTYATCYAFGVFRLGSRPERAVTADVVAGQPANRSAANVAKSLLDLAGFSGAYDTSSFATVNALNPAEVGVLINDDSDALDWIGKVLGSVDARLIPRMSDGVFQAVQIAAPTNSPLDTYTQRDIGVDSTTFSVLPTSQTGEFTPAWSIVVNWGKVWQTLDAGSIFPSVSDARRDLLMNGSSPAVSQDASVLVAFPKAAELTFETYFTNRADAQAEADRRLAMYKARRDHPNVTLPFARAQFRKIGETVAIKMHRLLYDAGRNFVIIGIESDYQKRSITLSLWG